MPPALFRRLPLPLLRTSRRPTPPPPWPSNSTSHRLLLRPLLILLRSLTASSSPTASNHSRSHVRSSGAGGGGSTGRRGRGRGGGLTSRSAVRDPSSLVELVGLIARDADDAELCLHEHLRNSVPTQASVSQVLHALTDRGVSALRFVDWVLKVHPQFRPSSENCDQIVDNIGRFHDYDAMRRILGELAARGHCLTEKAFAFLAARGRAGFKDSVLEVTQVLIAVGGSCRGSGIFSLIKLLSRMNEFHLAMLVMEETTRKTSYYHVLLASKCRTGDFQGVRELFDEMRKMGCDPNTKSYNYFLGSLFKHRKVAEACELLKRMEELGYCPDLGTFEVVAIHACKAGRMDFAIQFHQQMLSQGFRPSLAIHAAFIRGYFLYGRDKDAHEYLVRMSIEDKWSLNANYSLLANLYNASGRAFEAGRVLHEMMEKGLKPNFPVFMRVTKDLHKITRADLASELRGMFTKCTSMICFQ